MDIKVQTKDSKRYRLKTGEENIIHRRAKIPLPNGRFRIKAVKRDGTNSKYSYEKKVSIPLKDRQTLSFRITSSHKEEAVISETINLLSTPSISFQIEETPTIAKHLNIRTVDATLVPRNLRARAVDI